jgi:outer membrane protein OmpA-like peptidoglycan-associated protein
MSRRRSIVAAGTLFLGLVSTVMLAQNEPPAGDYSGALRDPQNAPLTLTSDIRTLVGLGGGVGGGALGLKADVQELENAMRDLGAQVKKVEIPAQVKTVANGAQLKKVEVPAQVKEVEIHVDLPGDVLFDFDKVDLKPAAEETLKKLATIIRAKSKGAVQINGFTDAKGSDPHNQKLSEGRAASVKAWLTTTGGISAAGLSTKGFGKANPVAPNTRPDGSDNPEGRARNRRVEVIIPTL